MLTLGAYLGSVSVESHGPIQCSVPRMLNAGIIATACRKRRVIQAIAHRVISYDRDAALFIYQTARLASEQVVGWGILLGLSSTVNVMASGEQAPIRT